MTTYYVTADAEGGGVGSQIDPWTIQEALNGLASGGSLAAADIVKIKAGSHSMSGNVTAANDGTVVAPIVFMACDASWNEFVPSRSATTKLLDHTSWGSIDFGSYIVNFSGSNSLIFRGLKITGSRAGYIINLGLDGAMFGCAVINAANSSSAYAIVCYNDNCLLYNCDAACTGSSSNAAISVVDISAKIINCVIYSSKADGILLSYSYGYSVVSGCLIYGYGTNGIKMSAGTSNSVVILNCTIDGGATGTKQGIMFVDDDNAYAHPITNCIITGNTVGIYLSHATGMGLIAASNHLYNNTTDIDWDGNTQEYGNIITETSDFRDAANADYRLDILAPALTAGPFGSPIGHIGIEDVAALANVLSSETLMGEAGTFVEADRNTDPGIANVKTGTEYKILNVSKTGEYSASGGGLLGNPNKRGGKQ